MELAESVGLIGPASRTHDLHAAIQRFHDLICANATIKAAVVFSRTLEAKDEPVAWVCYGAPGKRDIDFEEADINKLPIGTSLYTAPPAAQRPWQGLTDEDKKKIATAAGCTEDDDGHIVTEIFRLAEIKLKERNG
jgi:hypothetical protein